MTATRRDVVALAAAVFVARSSPAAAAAPDDAELLLRLIAREDEAAAAQDGVVASEERDHAAALRTLLDALGRQAPRGPASAPSQDLVALETSLIEEYRAAVLELRDPSILKTAGTILASHSQHRVKARIEAGLDPFASDP
ncbi:MAG TPA: hypothetical protein VFP78_13810 [Solirubrobacteraceae bacterium]|nr:hypothetical protein [Solirubrobacteraceae bacterium]